MGINHWSRGSCDGNDQLLMLLLLLLVVDLNHGNPYQGNLRWAGRVSDNDLPATDGSRSDERAESNEAKGALA